ncbi:iron-siderophore ABC transporter substrate-binding protein [Luteococcus peritonei]|uniref:Iron-siderophore ABC transporter substrate-binding protein n=1 Tax=Luteococcus peritonei TaxID=88874 RepID=A0ABW4RTT7_9ACTN
MNRRQLLTTLALSATLATVGCSSSPEAGSAASGSASGAAESGFPVTVATKFGDVTIEKKPTRVVALGWGDAEDALQLGVQPVGASDWLGFGGEGVGPWLKGKYTTAPTIIETMEPSYEKIAALKPDLILDVKSSGDQARHDKLKQIAPVVGVPKGGDSYLTTSDQQLEMIAAALGEKAKGEQLKAEVDAKVAKVTAANPGWKGKTASAVSRTSEGWGAYVKGGDRIDFLEKLGFVQNPKIAALPVSETGFSVKISAEKLDVIDSDLIIGFPIFVKPEQMSNDAAFKAVPAVKDGRALVLDGDLAQAFSLGSPAARSHAIDQLVPRIEAALK